MILDWNSAITYSYCTYYFIKYQLFTRIDYLISHNRIFQMITYQYVNNITYIRMYRYFHNNHASFLDFSNGYDNMVKSCQQVRSYQSIFLKTK